MFGNLIRPFFQRPGGDMAEQQEGQDYGVDEGILLREVLDLRDAALPISRAQKQDDIERWMGNGWRCPDTATFMDDGTYGGTTGNLRSIWNSGDGTHPNDAGQAAMGAFIAPSML